ncbi:MAG TPA: hypothetical protein VEU47_13855 [Candidatus Cybelea sp.]|nr:hypothetical protein [Candidatus Cybelea sp.]
MRTLQAAGIGAVTGAISASGAMMISGQFSIYVIPGLVFGVAFATLLSQQLTMKPWQVLGYVAAATAGNAAAVEVAMMIDGVLRYGESWNMAISGLGAGALGGGLLAAASVPLLGLAWGRLPASVVTLALTGGVLGAVFLPAVDDIDPYLFNGAGAYVFYIAWQAGYAAVSARTLWSNRSP